MTARPGRIKTIINTSDVRPWENAGFRESPELGQRVNQIWECLREEVAVAQQNEAIVARTHGN